MYKSNNNNNNNNNNANTTTNNNNHNNKVHTFQYAPPAFKYVFQIKHV